MSISARPIFVVAGVGDGSGTGGATARIFSKAGYRVALVARGADKLQKVADDINKDGGEAAAFPIPEYTYQTLHDVFDTIGAHAWPSPEAPEIRAALYNVGNEIFAPFLSLTAADVQRSAGDAVTGAFGFARRAILAFQQNAIDALGRRGVLLFTGATASLRGNVRTSAFAAGKFGIRALSQSLNKEFGKQNIHVAHAIIDGGILTNFTRSEFSDEADRKKWEENANGRLDSESIAKSYWYLANQDRSAWTWELDLRPAHEKW